MKQPTARPGSTRPGSDSISMPTARSSANHNSPAEATGHTAGRQGKPTEAADQSAERRCFTAPGLAPFSPEVTARRREHEKLTYLAMARIYCRKVHTGPREPYHTADGKLVRFFPGRSCSLCPDCTKRADDVLKRTARCPHMAYKTFCHNCPRPCHKEDPEGARMMRSSGPRLLFYHPIIGLRFFSYLFRVIRRDKKARRRQERATGDT